MAFEAVPVTDSGILASWGESIIPFELVDGFLAVVLETLIT